MSVPSVQADWSQAVTPPRTRKRQGKPKFYAGQVVRDNKTNGRYAQIVRVDYDWRYVTLRADTMEYDVPSANIRRLTDREAGRAQKSR